MNKNTGIIIGVIALIIIIGGVYAFINNQKKDVMENEVSVEQKFMEEKDEASIMDKGDTMMKVGSYEAYAPEKVVLASTAHHVVLFFRAGWCPTCRALDADIKANISKIPSNLAILDVNYDDSSVLKQKYGVTYQHTFVQVDKDGNLLKKWSGSPTLAELTAQVK